MSRRIAVTLKIVALLLLLQGRPAGIARASAPVAEIQVTGFYTLLGSFLQKHVEGGQVNYSAISKDRKALQQLVQHVAAYDLRKVTPSEKKAFYINAYNVLVIQGVMDSYPLKSVMEVSGFFDKTKYNVAGEHLTLNELENKKLREVYKDARIHFALVCAAKSCPPLLGKPYLPATLEQQLEKQTTQALQDPQFIQVKPKEGQVLVSEIFKWYEQDFLQEAPSIVAYINRYRQNKINPKYKVGYYTYSWDLNQVNR
ncbi:DUF547 domain-containing protein [Pontibacter ruber]|uniref:DUF547 domain-containing protein n=1 Tax=Pontibacter ruber TaxID=1343895 RepID=A0ABW5CW07_9BACT|nr:DUF547 domain-containing protein [Pontibacter ruber]